MTERVPLAHSQFPVPVHNIPNLQKNVRLKLRPRKYSNLACGGRLLHFFFTDLTEGCKMAAFLPTHVDMQMCI